MCTFCIGFYTQIFCFFFLEKQSFWGDRKDYFHYLTEGGVKSLEPLIKKVTGSVEVWL